MINYEKQIAKFVLALKELNSQGREITGLALVATHQGHIGDEYLTVETIYNLANNYRNSTALIGALEITKTGAQKDILWRNAQKIDSEFTTDFDKAVAIED